MDGDTGNYMYIYIDNYCIAGIFIVFGDIPDFLSCVRIPQS